LACRYICDYTQDCVNPWKAWPYVRYVWLVTPVAHMCSIWLVVLVAANRYWAVCRPHDSARVWTTRRTVAYISAVVLAVVAFNVPRVFEYRIESVPVVLTATSPAAVLNVTVNPVDLYYRQSLPAAHIETETATNESETVEWTLREARTAFGRSAFYRYVYKVLFVNILLVLLPLVTLVVLSVFVIRALRQTPSYRLSLMHTRPRLSADAPADAPAASAAAAAPSRAVVVDSCTENVVKVDDVVVEDGDQPPQQQQQQKQLNGQPADTSNAGCGRDAKATKAGSRFSLIPLKVCLRLAACSRPKIFHRLSSVFAYFPCIGLTRYFVCVVWAFCRTLTNESVNVRIVARFRK